MQLYLQHRLHPKELSHSGVLRYFVCVSHLHIAQLHIHSCSVAILFAHAFQPFAGASFYRHVNSDKFALLAVCPCHCSRTMVEADLLQLSPPQLVAFWHEHAGAVQPRSWL